FTEESVGSAGKSFALDRCRYNEIDCRGPDPEQRRHGSGSFRPSWPAALSSDQSLSRTGMHFLVHPGLVTPISTSEVPHDIYGEAPLRMRARPRAVVGDAEPTAGRHAAYVWPAGF